MSELKKEQILSDGLKRTIRITVPAEKLKGVVKTLIMERGKTHKEPGFRPGKVPFERLEKLFQYSAHEKAVPEVIQSTAQEWLQEASHVPVGTPQYTLETSSSEGDLVYTLSYELSPDVPEVSLDGLLLKKANILVADQDIEGCLAEWGEDETKLIPQEEGALSQEGDVLKLRLILKEDKKEKEEGADTSDAREFPLKLEEKVLPSHIYGALMGVAAGQKVDIPQPKPSKGQATGSSKDLAQPLMTLHVVSIAKEIPLGVGQELVERHGLQTLEELREKAIAELQENGVQLGVFWTKRQILDFLNERYTFEVPQELVAKEQQAIWKFIESQVASADESASLQAFDGQDSQDKYAHLFGGNFGKNEEELKEFSQKAAVRRVRLGYILNKLAHTMNVNVTSEEMSRVLEGRWRTYSEAQRNQELSFYKKNPEAVKSLVASIREEKLLALIADTVPQETVDQSLDDLQKSVEDAGDMLSLS